MNSEVSASDIMAELDQCIALLRKRASVVDPEAVEEANRGIKALEAFRAYLRSQDFILKLKKEREKKST